VAFQADDPIVQIADSVADLMAGNGYAFVEGEQREDLAIVLQSFLDSAGIAVDPEHSRNYYRKVAAQSEYLNGGVTRLDC
jgi:hypothetical protein